jgi:chromosome segregation ATPase
LIRLYEEQKEKKLGPSYFETKFRDGMNIAFFYSGFSEKDNIGKPGHAILVFFYEDDIMNENLEGMMRRIAHELLPQKDEPIFYALFQDYYDLLKNSELGPYWEGAGKKQEIMTDTTPKNNEEVQETGSKDDKQPISEKDEINSLKKHIWEQEEKLQHWRNEMADLNENNVNLMNKIKTLENQSEKQKETIELKEEEIKNLAKIKEEAERKISEMEQQVKENDDLKNLADKSNELIQEIERKDGEIKDLKEQIENLEKVKEDIDSKDSKIRRLTEEIDSLKSENEKLRNDKSKLEEDMKKLKNENERFLGTITNIKLDSKQLKDKLEGQNKNNDKIKDELIDMKKEIKVLRRERDHYKNIVKEKNLL